MIIGQVPCNGCIRCCKSDAVRLLPDDDADSYLTEPHPLMLGALMLAHKDNLDCIYLGETGCTIHDRRPRQCREMDCRLLATQINFTQARRLDKANKLKIGVWRMGKKLLKEDKNEKKS